MTLKLEAPENPNYAAVVVRLRQLVPLPGLDNLVGAPLLGFQALISKDHQVGELGIVLPPECQLSDEMAKANNLYRHPERNADQSATGYLEDTRRVRAISLRKHRSDCLWMPLASLAWTGVDVSALKEGDTFDTLAGKEVCRKYVVRSRVAGHVQPKAEPKFNRVDPRLFPLHVDTANYFRCADQVPQDAIVSVTQKVHGTSIRLAHIPVRRKLSWRDRLAKRLGVAVASTEYAHVYGSRRVTKDANNPDQAHYYGEDIWSTEGRKLDAVVPEDYIVFGELIGWTSDGAPIQKDYTYQLPVGTCQLFVYRVAHVNPRGIAVDLSWEQVKLFCAQNGLEHVRELWTGRHSELEPSQFLDKRFAEDGWPDAVPLDKGKGIVDEGICVRMEGMTPLVLKAKSPIFLAHETKALDAGTVDIEEDPEAVLA